MRQPELVHEVAHFFSEDLFSLLAEWATFGTQWARVVRPTIRGCFLCNVRKGQKGIDGVLLGEVGPSRLLCSSIGGAFFPCALKPKNQSAVKGRAEAVVASMKTTVSAQLGA